MSRTIAFCDGRGSIGGFYATVELDSGERVLVELTKERGGAFAKLTKTRLGGLLPGVTLVKDPHVMDDFAKLGPQGVSAENRSRLLLLRLTALAKDCGSTTTLAKRFADLPGEGFYEDERWANG